MRELSYNEHLFFTLMKSAQLPPKIQSTKHTDRIYLSQKISVYRSQQSKCIYKIFRLLLSNCLFCFPKVSIKMSIAWNFAKQLIVCLLLFASAAGKFNKPMSLK